MKNDYLKEYIDEIIEKYIKDNLSGCQIAKFYGVGNNSIYNILKKNGVKIKKIGSFVKKYTINENYFDKIDTHEKAYFIGILMADGYNHNSKREVILTQSEPMKDIIYKLQNEIGSNCPIKIRTKESPTYDAFELAIYNTHISNKLLEYGIVQNKSHVTKFPDNINEKFYNSFLLGYYDGDGGISMYAKNYNNHTINFTGNSKLILEIKNIIDKRFSINGWIGVRHKEAENIITLVYTGNNSVSNILTWFYSDCKLHIDLKYVKYLGLLEINRNVLINRNISKEKTKLRAEYLSDKNKKNRKDQFLKNRDIFDKNIVEDLNSGYNIRQIKIKYGRNSEYIRRVINENNIEYVERGKRKKAKII